MKSSIPILVPAFTFETIICLNFSHVLLFLIFKFLIFLIYCCYCYIIIIIIIIILMFIIIPLCLCKTFSNSI